MVDEKQAKLTERADLKPGATVRVHQKIKEGDKERIQIFEGIILKRRNGPTPTITVRKIASGVGVERIFPLALPTLTKIDVVKQAAVRRAKLHFLRDIRARKLKEKQG